MRTIVGILMMILFVGANKIYSQNVSTPYEVGTWQGFHKAAISYTFDDNCPNQISKVLPMFNQFGYRMTFYTVINWSPNWTALQGAAAMGHEVGSHTLSHPSLNTVSVTQQISELKTSHDNINAKIPGNQCITIAYPNCVTSIDTIVSKYYISARGCQGFIEGKTPGNFLNVSSLICGNVGAVNTSQDFSQQLESAVNKNGWCVFLIHAIDDDNGYSPLPSATLKASLHYIKSATVNKFWVSTFSNVSRYIKERNAASVKEIAKDDTSFTIQVTDTLVDSIFNFPLSIRRPLPKTWPSANVVQNGNAKDASIIKIDTMVYLMFDVVPNGGSIVLSESNISVIPIADTIHGIDTIKDPVVLEINKLNESTPGSINIWLHKSTLMFASSELNIQNLSISIFNMSGILIKNFRNYNITNGIGTVDLSEIKTPGIYIVRLNNGKKSWAKQIVLN